MNQVTLDCLMNKSQYKNYVSKKYVKVNNRDKKFYRKRIFSLTKELLTKKEEDPYLIADINCAFDNFVNTCIQYFKITDNNDTIQEDYQGMDDLTKLNNILELDVDNIETKDEADKLLMRSIKISRYPLDDFVKKKYTKSLDDMILPKQKDINLHDPKFKTKGVIISEKKKNITNKYDENNNSEKNEETKKCENKNNETPS